MNGNSNPITSPVWVTRWALSTGVRLYKKGELVNGGKYFTSGRDCFVGRADYALTEKEAREQVHAKAAAKLKALDKQTKKVRTIFDGEFKVEEVE